MSSPPGRPARYGSDVIVDILQQSGIEHIALNPGASFRGIHDSLVHTEGAPELILALHESIAVGMAQGYVKATGRPMGVLLHNVVGLQNASMSIYNAWRDRAPMLLLGGTGPKSTKSRRRWIDWIHTASVQGNAVRDFVVWDNEPHDLHSVTDSVIRGLRAATDAPGGPVYLCFDVDLQEDQVPAGFATPAIAGFEPSAAPAAAGADVIALAELFHRSERPAIVCGFVGETNDAFTAVVELADRTGAAVVDTGVRHAFPTSHPLAATGVPGVLEEADAILLLDVDDVPRAVAESRGTVVNVSLSTLRLRSWAQDYQTLLPGRTIVAGADAMVGALLDVLRQKPVSADLVLARTDRVSSVVRDARAAWLSDAASATAEGAVALERLLYEVGECVRGKRFVLANATNSRLEHRTWSLDGPRQYLGWHNGGGLGYGLPAAIGASIGLGPDTIVVDIQADGDLLFLPSALWSAARYRTPTLIVVNNNRQYGNTVEHAQKVAGNRGRSDERRYEGSGLQDPPVSFTELARSFGVWAWGPISDPQELNAALFEALEVVRSGRPALLDVLTPGF